MTVIKSRLVLRTNETEINVGRIISAGQNFDEKFNKVVLIIPKELNSITGSSPIHYVMSWKQIKRNIMLDIIER